MSTVKEVTPEMELLAETIADIIKDYKHKPVDNTYDLFYADDKTHVLDWVWPFNENDRLFVLRQMKILVEKRYLCKAKYIEMVSTISTMLNAKKDTDNFFLDIQKKGHSQKDILTLFEEQKIPINIIRYPETPGALIDIKKYQDKTANFIYLDDVSITGDRIHHDIVEWIAKNEENGGPTKTPCMLTIIILFHFAEKAQKTLRRQLKYLIYESNKNVSLHFDHAPVMGKVFENKADSDRLEKILFDAGVLINPNYIEKNNGINPLGYKKYLGSGFDDIVLPYRNCPNNTPLVFWWSVKGRYPLMKRIGY